MIQGMELDVIKKLIINNLNILFEQNIYPNYLLNLLKNVNNLFDIYKFKYSEKLYKHKNQN